MNWSDERNELAAALAIAQGKIESARKDNVAKGAKFTYQYSSLEDVWKVARKPLSENGLSVVQIPSNDENGFFLETILLHSSGQWVSSGRMRLPVDASRMSEIQAMGSAITYARRYQLGAMVGVSVSTDDDDGQAAGNAARSQPAQRAKPDNGTTGATSGKALDDFLARTRIELNLSEENTKAILKELGHKVFAPDKSGQYFESLRLQLNESATTETAMFVVVNAVTDGYYKNIHHLRNAMKNIDPGFDYPPGVDDHSQWQVCLSLAVEHANANKEDENRDKDEMLGLHAGNPKP